MSQLPPGERISLNAVGGAPLRETTPLAPRGTVPDAELASFVGDQACVRERVTIADDVVIGRGSLVENDTTIGALTKIQAHAYITAYSTLEDNVFIAPCVVTTNDNFMGRTERRKALLKGATIRRGARVGADGLTLKVPVSNAQPGPCGSDYTAAAAESDTAVAVAVKEYPHASPGEAVICPAMLVFGYVTVTLKAALAGRVLLDERGKVGAVCPETGDC